MRIDGVSMVSRWSDGQMEEEEESDVEIRNNMKLPAAARLVPAAWR
jgi:hypothetical protein